MAGTNKRESIIAKALMTKKGRTSLYMAMTEPIRRSLNYVGIGKLSFNNYDDLQRKEIIEELKMKEEKRKEKWDEHGISSIFKSYGLNKKYSKGK